MVDRDAILKQGKEVLRKEAASILKVEEQLGEEFVQAVDILYQCSGRVVTTGIGKSGLICKKIAATLSSTGTPSFFMHPADAIHGDLGMIVPGDVVVAISNSGETSEIKQLIPFIQRFMIKLISITGNPNSTLARFSDVVLRAEVEEEACPLNLAPTTSTTVALVIGDALAMSLIRKRGFRAEEFAQFHPGGKLGRRLLKVKDLMHSGSQMPIVGEWQPMKEAIYEISGKRLGMTCVVNQQGEVTGIVTDGDIRRLLEKDISFLTKPVGQCMSLHPKMIDPDSLAEHAVQVMETHSITSLLITDQGKKPMGVIHLHDLLKAGVV
ncbi:MAG: KpsF/GutQ family sugar-phosphate isomerase [bacterium]